MSVTRLPLLLLDTLVLPAAYSMMSIAAAAAAAAASVIACSCVLHYKT